MTRQASVPLLVAIVFAAGCGPTISQINDSAIQAAAAEDLDTSAPPRVLHRLDADSRDSDYRIGPEDLLEINFFELEDLNKSNTVMVRVSEQGEVMLPLLGVRVPSLSKANPAPLVESQVRLNPF